MRGLDKTTGALLVLAMGIAFAVDFSPPQAVTLVQARRPDGALPPLREARDVHALAQMIGRSKLWGIAPAQGKGRGAAPVAQDVLEWRIAGVFSSADGARQLILSTVRNGVAQAPEFLRHGDRLPGGAIIHSIEEERVCLRLDNTLRWLPVHRPAPIPF